MSNNRQVEFIKAQLEDINYLIGMADKGYEVGDILKLEARREQLENKLSKLEGKEEVVELNKQDEKEDMTAMELYEMRRKVEELEKARSKKRNIILFVALFIWMTIVAIVGVANSNKVNLDEAKKFRDKIDEIEKQNYCYRVLYNEDEIGNGCEEYFKDDSWYKEYLEDVAKMEEGR